MYRVWLYSGAATQQFTVPLFTIQEWTSFTPGRVILCIVGIMVLPQLLSSLLYNYLLLSSLLYNYLLYKGCHKILLAGLYYV